MITIRRLPKTRLAVAHEPETPRYSLARLKLRHLVEQGEFLGLMTDAGRPNEVEIALWAPSKGRSNAGYYGCFRGYMDQDGDVLSAVLFCSTTAQKDHQASRI